METEKYWLKFILSGKPEDYLKYIGSKAESKKAVDGYSLFDRGPGDSQEQYR